MQDRFGDRQYGYRVCLHEAAHAILMEQSGIKNVHFSGPAILFDLERNPRTGFVPAGAMASGCLLYTSLFVELERLSRYANKTRDPDKSGRRIQRVLLRIGAVPR